MAGGPERRSSDIYKEEPDEKGLLWASGPFAQPCEIHAWERREGKITGELNASKSTFDVAIGRPGLDQPTEESHVTHLDHRVRRRARADGRAAAHQPGARGHAARQEPGTGGRCLGRRARRRRGPGGRPVHHRPDAVGGAAGQRIRPVRHRYPQRRRRLPRALQDNDRRRTQSRVRDQRAGSSRTHRPPRHRRGACARPASSRSIMQPAWQSGSVSTPMHRLAMPSMRS
jgi:hypothetical protein